ncbi:MAG: hypothetical protein KC656_34010, partial [Myxococcales bacterium]|nr:hypothetical protein [Myxococcales bacterium]
FGKAKLRPKEHEAYFEDRFDLLLDRYPLHREAEDLLHELLMSMLAFDEPDRPSAADAVARLRSFARRITEHPLEEWAEQTVPPLLRATREKSEARSPGSLVDTILTEDAKALDQRSIWDENTGASTRALDLNALEDELTGSLADDARWKALKQATIEDMAKRGEIQRPADGPTEPADADELDPDTDPDAEPIADPVPLDRGPARVPPPPRPPPVEQDSPPTPLEPLPVPDRRKPPRPAPPPDEVEIDHEPESEPTLVAAPPKAPPRPEPPPPPRAPKPRRRKQGSSRKGLVATVAVMFLVGSGLALIGMSLLGIVLALSMMATPTVSAVPIPLPPQPVEVEPVGVEPVEPEPAPEPVPVDGPHVRFVSARSNTERMQVSCDSGRETG